MSIPSSNIRIFVTFKEDAIFAGEELEATITFKNIETNDQITRALKPRLGQGPEARPPSTSSQLHSRPAHSRQTSIASQASRFNDNNRVGHRHALSLNLPTGTPREGQAGPNPPDSSTPPQSYSKHGRSVSIISLGSDTDGTGNARNSATRVAPVKTAPYKLSRSASLQVAPTASRYNNLNGASSPLSTTQTSSTMPDVAPQQTSSRRRDHPRKSPMGPPSSYKAPPLEVPQSASGKLEQSFKFPFSPAGNEENSENNSLVGQSQPSLNGTNKSFATYPRRNEAPVSLKVLQRPNLHRVLSQSTEASTARSSLDLNSVSDSSDETLISEYATQPASRLLARRDVDRKPSPLSRPQLRNVSESLMMGYAQVSGSFTLDHSLVQQAPFEQVKRKAVVGGQGGGGVVGVDTAKRDNGLFGSFNWGNISSSIGGMLGNNELSSIKEMKGIANAESVPLLSTPKSILFVDLKLAPGESKSFKYIFKLPRGLPPTHRGRAMKVTYKFVIGTQRSPYGRSGKQQIHQTDISFRVFSGVNIRGEDLGHDLMSPYVILRDQARTSLMDPSNKSMISKSPLSVQRRHSIKNALSVEADFKSYVSKLVSTSRSDSAAELLSPAGKDEPIWPRSSPTSPTRNRSDSVPQVSARLLVDNAIRMSSQPTGHTSLNSSSGEQDEAENQANDTPNTSQNQFTIARSGNPLAHLTLSRPALRLGELFRFLIDFWHPSCAGSHVPIYAVAITLESSEHIDPSLAIRSTASVDRATRRIWDRRVVGGNGGVGLGWCSKWGGELKIPVNATPGFSTTGVSVEWRIRLEMVIGASPRSTKRQNVMSSSDEDMDDIEHDDSEEQASNAGDLESNKKNENSNSQEKDSAKEISDSKIKRASSLLHQLNADERGSTYVAIPRVPCETFEVAIPVKVFGAVGAAGSYSNATSGDGFAV